jgi:hypothetical protein
MVFGFNYGDLAIMAILAIHPWRIMAILSIEKEPLSPCIIKFGRH